MKKFVAILFAVVLFSVSADTWTDPNTGITWTYTVRGGEASVVGSALLDSPAIPKATKGAITIPSSLGGYPLTSIGSYAFYRCSSLTSVTIPLSVTSIGLDAFVGCSSLTSVTIPSSVTSIGGYAFSGTPFYDNQPDGMVILGGGVLYKYKGDCPAIVTIPEGVTSIGSYAFYRCTSLTSVTMPEGVTSIGSEAFSDCTNLALVKLPKNLNQLGDDAFSRTPYQAGLNAKLALLAEFGGTSQQSTSVALTTTNVVVHYVLNGIVSRDGDAND